MTLLLAIATLILTAALGFTLATALVNQVDRAVPPHLSAQGLGWLAREWAAATLMPVSLLVGLWGRHSPLPPGQLHRAPILLIPGYGLNRGSLLPLARYLRARGWPSVQAVDPLPRSAPLADQARALASHVEATLQATGAPQVILIGHSMGGLVAGWYVNKMNGAPRTQHLITLGSAWRGTRMHIWGRRAHELRPGSPTLTALLPPAVRVTAIYTPTDGIVSPPEHAWADGMQRVEVPNLGHLQMLFSARMFRTIDRALGGTTEAEE